MRRGWSVVCFVRVAFELFQLLDKYRPNNLKKQALFLDYDKVIHILELFYFKQYNRFYVIKLLNNEEFIKKIEINLEFSLGISIGIIDRRQKDINAIFILLNPYLPGFEWPCLLYVLFAVCQTLEWSEASSLVVTGDPNGTWVTSESRAHARGAHCPRPFTTRGAGARPPWRLRNSHCMHILGKDHRHEWSCFKHTILWLAIQESWVCLW